MERYEAYKKSGIAWACDIPTSWDSCEISYLSACSNGATPSRDVPAYWGGDIPWMASGEIHQGYVTKTAEFITQEGLENSSTKLLPVHTVMIALNGQGKTKGTPAILGIEACSNQSLAGFICDESRLHFRWLYYCFISMYSYLRGESGQAQRDGIAASDLKKENVPLPPVGQQRAIADYLDAKTAEIDALVADCEREAGLLREYRKAVISEAVTKGLDPDAPMKDSGVEWIGEIPEGWGFPKLGMLLHGMKDGTHSTHARVYSGRPLLSAKNVRENSILITDHESMISEEDYSTIVACGYPKQGDVLLTTIGGSIGRAVVYTLDDVYAFQRSVIFLRPMEGLLDSRYLCYMLRSNLIQTQMFERTAASAQDGIYSGDIARYQAVLPSLVEQRVIADYLDLKTAEIDSLIDAKQSMADKLREYRKSLISEAVTGKFKVPGVK